MYTTKTFVIFVFTLIRFVAISEEGSCSKAFGCSESSILGKPVRYILYDVNPGEGFNLRRDVYMRMAIFIHHLTRKSKYDWHLVLPPWSHIWHWKNEEVDSSFPWKKFFDVSSLQLFAPVMELEDFIAEYGTVIDEAYVLQHFPDFYSWSEGKEIDWSERWNFTLCRSLHRNESNETYFFFFGKNEIKTTNFQCISFHGTAGFLESVISSTNAKAMLFDRAETVTHIMYGDSDYWMCRRSMRFSHHLVEAANNFRAVYLNSTDTEDGTVQPLDFRDATPHRTARGGPYLGVHLRRREFQMGHPDAVPSLLETVKQIKKHTSQLGLTSIYVATDATDREYSYIKSMLRADDLFTFRFINNNLNGTLFRDAELAIIDQIIASHARFFVGTYESTFTYRIQEEREIMGFNADTTFNRFCPTSSMENCTPPTKWLIKYPEDMDYSDINKRTQFQFDEL